MTDRLVPPSGGGMTEATGSLTPDDSDAPFVPAELRAINRPEIAHAATIGARQRSAAEHGPMDDPGSLGERPLEEIGPNERDGGYGSEHGLAPNDPAYAFDERPSGERPTASDPLALQEGRGTRLGGDERHAPEDEHF
jgi:hypothetical protein